MADVAIIGAGSWGIALAKVLHTNGNKVTVWSIVEDEITMLTTLTKEQLHDLDTYEVIKQTEAGENFQEILKKIKERRPYFRFYRVR